MSLSRRVLISMVALAFTLVTAPTAAKTAAAQNRVTAGAIMSEGLPHCCGGGDPPGPTASTT